MSEELKNIEVIKLDDDIKKSVSFLQKTSRILMAGIRTIYAGCMTIIDFILTLHSEAPDVSWKRVVGSVIVVFSIVTTGYGIKHNLINGDMLTKIITTAIGSIAVIYGAGVIASNIGSGTQSKAYAIIEKFKSFFTRKI